MVYLTFQPFQPLRGAIFGAHVLAWKHPPKQLGAAASTIGQMERVSEIFELVVEPTHLKNISQNWFIFHK